MGEFNQASVTTLSENEFSLSLPWPVPGCEIVGSAKLRKRVHKNKREETGKRKGDYIFECLSYASSLLSESQECAPPTLETALFHLRITATFKGRSNSRVKKCTKNIQEYFTKRLSIFQT